MDLLKKMQAAGKGLQIDCTADQIPIFCRELRPEKVLYITATATQKEAEDLLERMKTST